MSMFQVWTKRSTGPAGRQRVIYIQPAFQSILSADLLASQKKSKIKISIPGGHHSKAAGGKQW